VGEPAAALAFARAAHAQNTPAVAVLPVPPDRILRESLEAAGCAIRIDGSPAAAPAAVAAGPWAGFTITPGPEDADVAAGVATVVQELVQELPADTMRLVVAPAALADAVAQGVALLGLPWCVEAAAGVTAAAAHVRDALAEHHALQVTPEGAAALAHALAAAVPATCVLLGV
jgi:threonine dehydratase